jgi:cytochrome P450
VPDISQHAHAGRSAWESSRSLRLLTSGILHDEANVGPHPERFVPERYLPGGGATLSTADIAFGYGRRICPGRFMGRTTDWIAIASILTAFNISPALDEHGREIIPEEKYESGLAT